MENAVFGTYVASLDADMIPMPHWLRCLMPHIEDNADCAMVCPPQVCVSSAVAHMSIQLTGHSSRPSMIFPSTIL
jgi:cellulose synthase/poly-beta-1,6-N-acetylglucosamine synthase-like glycosyltransferase